MSSQRFPGKVLQPFLGQPILYHLLKTVESVSEVDQVVVLTSDHPSDDPLENYLRSIDCRLFRGPLEDVFGRFRAAAIQFPSDWVLRLCADSPLLSPLVVREVASRAADDVDVVTTRFDPPFPKGQNAELIRTQSLLDVDVDQLTDHDREHVTPWFYRHRDAYRIANANGVQIDLPDGEFTVDTPADLARLESMFAETNQQSKENR